MKNIAFLFFRFLVVIVLLAKVSNWFFNFDDQTNQIINSAMFSIIGIAYMVIGFYWDGKRVKAIFLCCGAFLIAMNFFKLSDFIGIAGIICILTPMLIARFSPIEESDEIPVK